MILSCTELHQSNFASCRLCLRTSSCSRPFSTSTEMSYAPWMRGSTRSGCAVLCCAVLRCAVLEPSVATLHALDWKNCSAQFTPSETFSRIYIQLLRVSLVVQMSIMYNMFVLFRSVASKIAKQKYLHEVLFEQSLAPGCCQAMCPCCTAECGTLHHTPAGVIAVRCAAVIQGNRVYGLLQECHADQCLG